MRVTVLVAAVLAILLSSPARTQTATKGTATTSKALIDKYCISCHSDKLKTGGLSLENADLTKVADHGDVWEKVVRKLRNGAMPPVGLPKPDDSTLTGFTNRLEESLDKQAAAWERTAALDPSSSLGKTATGLLARIARAQKAAAKG